MTPRVGDRFKNESPEMGTLAPVGRVAATWVPAGSTWTVERVMADSVLLVCSDIPDRPGCRVAICPDKITLEMDFEPVTEGRAS